METDRLNYVSEAAEILAGMTDIPALGEPEQ